MPGVSGLQVLPVPSPPPGKRRMRSFSHLGVKSKEIHFVQNPFSIVILAICVLPFKRKRSICNVTMHIKSIISQRLVDFYKYRRNTRFKNLKQIPNWIYVVLCKLQFVCANKIFLKRNTSNRNIWSVMSDKHSESILKIGTNNIEIKTLNINSFGPCRRSLLFLHFW